MLRKIVGVSIAALLLVIPVVAKAGQVLDRISSSKTLTMATDSNLPPISFINAENEMDGFDVDVGKELAKRLGAELKIVTPDWTVITSGHWMGRWDVSVGSMTPTNERAKVLDFPAIYYYTPASLAVHKDSPYHKIEELNGKIVGAPGSTTYEQYLRHNLAIDAVGTPSFTYQITTDNITTMATSTALLDDLRLGAGVRLDGIVYATPSLKEAIQKGYPIRLVGGPLFYEPLAIAIDKGDDEFGKKIAEIIKAMKDDGTLVKLSEKWFGTDYSKVVK